VSESLYTIGLTLAAAGVRTACIAIKYRASNKPRGCFLIGAWAGFTSSQKVDTVPRGGSSQLYIRKRTSEFTDRGRSTRQNVGQ